MSTNPMLEVQLEPQPDYLLVTVTGAFDVQAAIDDFPRLLVACRHYDLTRVIIDYRSVVGEIVFSEEIVYALGISDYYRQHLAANGKPLRFAFLGAHSRISSWVPGQEMAAANGLVILLTTDMETAIEWLCDEAVTKG